MKYHELSLEHRDSSWYVLPCYDALTLYLLHRPMYIYLLHMHVYLCIHTMHMQLLHDIKNSHRYAWLRKTTLWSERLQMTHRVIKRQSHALYRTLRVNLIWTKQTDRHTDRQMRQAHQSVTYFFNSLIITLQSSLQLYHLISHYICWYHRPYNHVVSHIDSSAEQRDRLVYMFTRPVRLLANS